MGIYVILGSTGMVGASTIRELRRTGQEVRAVVRSASQSSAWEELGCQVALADLGDPDSLVDCFRGAIGVQVICPPDPKSKEPLAQMARLSENIIQALRMARPRKVVVISDYGANLDRGSGITLGFHGLEARLAQEELSVTIIRSAEHMENWRRIFPAVIKSGVVPSMHHPLSKPFSTVSAPEVGQISARELTALDEPRARVIHVEGPHRYTAFDVAEALGIVAGIPVSAIEAPKESWVPRLCEGGMSLEYARLLEELYTTHNLGGIDVESGGEVVRGSVSLVDALFKVWRPSA